jgi:putative ABC transport system permease protein
LWPGQNPIGRRLKWGPPQSDDPWYTVVGVVGDVKEGALERESMLHSYEPATSLGRGVDALRSGNWVIRSGQAPAALIASVRAAVASLDPQLPVAKLETMEQTVEGSLSSRRLQTYVIGLFAGAALLLAAIGIYGLIAYSVTQRTREIGIRMALGATASGVVRLILRQALALTVLGIAAGVLLSFGLTRYISSLLFGVKPTDTVTFGAVALVLLVVTAVASFVPARRAMRVDPMTALRRE